jgi:hypothetical protein
MYPARAEVDNFFKSFPSQWKLNVVERDDGAEYHVAHGSKKVFYFWSPNRPEEMFYVLQNGSTYEFEDWTEIFESEESARSHFEYLRSLAERYLNHQTRFRKRWHFLGSPIPQYQKDGLWHDLRSAT